MLIKSIHGNTSNSNQTNLNHLRTDFFLPKGDTARGGLIRNRLISVGLGGDLIRMSIHEKYSASTNITSTWIILVIVEQNLVQIGRRDGPTEYLS